MKCYQCNIEIKKRPYQLRKNKKHFCSTACRGKYQMTLRNMDKVSLFERLINSGIGFNAACRGAKISKATGWLIKKGFYQKDIPHKKYRKKAAKEGYFNVNEMEWI